MSCFQHPQGCAQANRKVAGSPWWRCLFLSSLVFLAGNETHAQGQTSFSQAASAEAAPTWTTPAERSAPQVQNLVSLFQSLRHGESDEIRKGVLLCDVQVTHPKRWDSFAAPDLNVTLSIGKGDQAFRYPFKGPQDRSNFTFSLPLISLQLRNRIGISLTDRDVFQNEFIGSDVDVFAGAMPLTFDSGTFTGECRALIGEALQHQVKKSYDASKHLLAQLQSKKKPKADLPFLGLAKKQQHLLHRHLVYLAALVGWHDERLG
ncbi:MAG: hypothetical protein GY822_18330 [Deltaproteobacteria bacterium]|nr:hypothetical protein [Deltaproteobacteria bacterium]